MVRHGVRVPSRIDGLLLFDQPRGGFHGIILEAKSGSQGPSEAVLQLKCYRAALRESIPGPMIIWGVVENPESLWWNGEILRERQPGGDLWLFTPASAVEEAARLLVG